MLIRVIGSGVLGRFKIESYFHIGFYIIVNLFLSWVKSISVTRLGKSRIIESVLKFEYLCNLFIFLRKEVCA